MLFCRTLNSLLLLLRPPSAVHTLNMSENTTSLFSSSLDCSDLTASFFISTSFNITRVCLLLPLSVFILCVAHRPQRSFKTMSHSDMFTYNNAVLQLICSVGIIIYTCGNICEILYVQIAGSGFVHFFSLEKRAFTSWPAWSVTWPSFTPSSTWD